MSGDGYPYQAPVAPLEWGPSGNRGLERLRNRLVQWYGQAPGGKKFMAWATLGGPFFADLMLAKNDPKFWEDAPKVRWIEVRHPQLGRSERVVDPRDAAKLAQWAIPKLGRTITDATKMKEFRDREPGLTRVWREVSTDPSMYLMTPLRLGVKYGVPLAGRLARRAGAEAGRGFGRVGEALVGKERIGAISKGLERFFVSPVARVKKFGDEELLRLWYRVREQQEVKGAIGAAAKARVKAVVKGYKPAEIAEAGLLLQRAENTAEYARRVAAKEIPAAVNPRAVPLAAKMRKELTHQAYEAIPGPKTAISGTPEWTAAKIRITRAGGVAPASLRPLRAGERRLEKELGKQVDASGKLIGRVDKATGERVVAFRQRYFPLGKPRPAPAGPPRLPGVGGPVVGARLPRVLRREIVRNAEEVKGVLGRMVATEPRVAALEPGLAENFVARASQLADPRAEQVAAELLGRLQAERGTGAVNKALGFLDSWVVAKVKRVFTIYNPAWYLKNYLDTVWTKNLLAGVPLKKLHQFALREPVDIFGKAARWGDVTWTKELTGLSEGALRGLHVRLANGIENTGRRAVGDLIYWKEIERLGGAVTLRGRGRDALMAAHEQAFLLAKKAVAKVHFDYGDVSKTDEVLRRLFPFWMYQRNQLRWAVEQAVERPRLAIAGVRGYEASPKVRIGSLEFNPADLLSPMAMVKVVARGGQVTRDWEERVGVKPGTAEHLVRRGEQGGFYLHPVVEQVLGAVWKGKGGMDDRSWKTIAPQVDALGKLLGVNLTWYGVKRVLLPEYKGQVPLAPMQRAFKRRVAQRVAFSMAEGKPMTTVQATGYVRGEMRRAAVGVIFGSYSKVRDPGYERMQALLKKRRELPWDYREQFERAHPEMQMFLDSLEIRDRPR